MTANRAPFDGLSEIVRGSQLQVRFSREGNKSFIIHTGSRRRHSGEEKWIVQRHIGAGGQGSVVLHTRVTGEDGQPSMRAVKRIIVPCANLESLPKSNQRELETIAKFSQAKYLGLFVASYGWYFEQGFINITMEYCELGDLLGYLQNKDLCPQKCLPEGEAREISGQVLDALSTMHEEGFCHRDLKPANILIKRMRPRWWVKVADFGLSKRDGSTTSSFFGGSMGYMAPELFGWNVQGKKVDPYAVDMWSMGQVVAKLMTGKVLFPTRSDINMYFLGTKAFPEERLTEYQASQSLIDFVRSLSSITPNERLTVRAALDHPWIRQSGNWSFGIPNTERQDLDTTESESYSNAWSDGYGGPENIPDIFTNAEPSHLEETGPSLGSRFPTPSLVTSDPESRESSINNTAEDFKNAGNVFFKEKKYNLAIAQYTKAIQESPSSSIYRANRAAAYMAQFQWENALEDCKKAIDLEQTPTVKLQLRLGRVYTRMGRASDALSVYSKIWSDVPEKYRTQAKEIVRCIAWARKALNNTKDYPSVHALLKKAKVYLGPGLPTPREWLIMEAEAYIQIGLQSGENDNLDKAYGIVDGILHTKGSDTEALQMMGRIDAIRNKSYAIAKVKDVTGDCVNPTPTAEDCVNEITRLKDLGNDAYKRHQFNEAIEIYSKALSVCSKEKITNSRVLQNRAQAYIRVGRYQNAIEDCDRAVNLDVSYVKAYRTKDKAMKLSK